MSGTAVLIGLGLTVLLGFSVYFPLLHERRQRTSAYNSAAQRLEEELVRLISAVRDLDFDFDTGKLAEDDYITQRKLLIGRGVSTLLKVEQARQQENQVDQEIERLVTVYRQKHS